MENNEVFTYRYSAAQNREVERIRKVLGDNVVILF